MNKLMLLHLYMDSLTIMKNVFQIKYISLLNHFINIYLSYVFLIFLSTNNIIVLNVKNLQLYKLKIK